MNFLGLHSNQIDKDAAYYVMNSLSRTLSPNQSVIDIL